MGEFDNLVIMIEEFVLCYEFVELFGFNSYVDMLLVIKMVEMLE